MDSFRTEEVSSETFGSLIYDSIVYYSSFVNMLDDCCLYLSWLWWILARKIKSKWRQWQSNVWLEKIRCFVILRNDHVIYLWVWRYFSNFFRRCIILQWNKFHVTTSLGANLKNHCLGLKTNLWSNLDICNHTALILWFIVLYLRH